MKKIIFILSLVFVCVTGFSQVIKYRTQSYAECKLDKTSGKWGEWTPNTDLNILVTIDLDNLRIKLYAGEVVSYDIVHFDGESSSENGDIITKLQCIDDEGKRCGVRCLNSSSKDRAHQLYIDFSDTIMVFNMKVLD